MIILVLDHCLVLQACSRKEIQDDTKKLFVVVEVKWAQKGFRNFDIAKWCCFWTIGSSTTSEHCTYGGLRVMIRRSSIGVDLRSCLLTWVITSLGGSAVSAVTVISVGHLTVRTSFSHENMGLMSREGLWHTVTITVLSSGEDNCHKHQVIFVYHTCYCDGGMGFECSAFEVGTLLFQVWCWIVLQLKSQNEAHFHLR